MYALRNKVQLIGRLGITPEIKTFESGRKKARFTIATNENFRNAKGEKVEETHWHNVIAWGKLAEIAEKHFVKGKQLAIEGKLTSRSYNDKDGTTRYISEIVMNEFEFIGSKSKAE